MACTIRIASSSASFAQPEVKLGIIPGFGGTQRLPRLVGRGRALQLILEGSPIGALEAWRIGLVDEVTEPDQLMTRASELLRKITANAPIALRLAIDAVNHGLEHGPQAGLALERGNFALCVGTDDQRRRVRVPFKAISRVQGRVSAPLPGIKRRFHARRL